MLTYALLLNLTMLQKILKIEIYILNFISVSAIIGKYLRTKFHLLGKIKKMLFHFLNMIKLHSQIYVINMISFFEIKLFKF